MLIIEKNHTNSNFLATNNLDNLLTFFLLFVYKKHLSFFYDIY